MTKNLEIAFCITECKSLGEKGQSIEQQRLCLSRLLLCLNQLDTEISAKQAEEIFFAVTKTFQQPSQQVHALAIQVIGRIQHLNKSSFFATRSVVQCFEKEAALQPQSCRLLGLIGNQNSLADIQKCVRMSTLDPKNQRLMASAAVAAKLQKIQLAEQLVEKVNGPAGALIVDCFPVDKIVALGAKSGNIYSQTQVVENISKSQLDEKKKLQVFMQYLPATAKEAMYEKLMVYQQTLHSLSLLSFATLKQNMLIIFQAFQLIFGECQQDYEKIAMLKQALKIYSNALNHGASQEVAPMNKLLLELVQSSNQTIQTLATIHLITSTKNPQTIMKLSTLVPSLSGELKQSALDLLQQLTGSPEIFPYLVPILQDFMLSSDAQIKKSAFTSLFQIIANSTDAALQNRLLFSLLESFDDQNDKETTRQICVQLNQINIQDEAEARRLAMCLWQRALLDGVQIRLAAVETLSRFQEQFPFIGKILEQIVSVLDDGYVAEIARPRKVDLLDNFNADDILASAEQILTGSVDVVFKPRSKKQKEELAKDSTKEEPKPEKEMASKDIIELNPNWRQYKSSFCNSQFVAISPASADVQVEVCKAFYFKTEQDKAGQAMFVFKINSDGDLSEGMLKIGKEKIKGDEQILVFRDFEQVEEVGLKKLKYEFVLEEEEDEIALDELTHNTFDLVGKDYPKEFEQMFNSQPENLQKYNLAEIQTIDELCEVLQSNTGLQMVDLQREGKKASFWLLGSVFGAGEVLVKCEAKQLKGQGCGVKMDFRGKAGSLIQNFFE